MGAGHAALAVSPAGPVQAVPPATPHRGPPQHRLAPRGQDGQRLHPQFSGLRPAGEWEPLSDASDSVAELGSPCCPGGRGWAVSGRPGPGGWHPGCSGRRPGTRCKLSGNACRPGGTAQAGTGTSLSPVSTTGALTTAPCTGSRGPLQKARQAGGLLAVLVTRAGSLPNTRNSPGALPVRSLGQGRPRAFDPRKLRGPTNHAETPTLSRNGVVPTETRRGRCPAAAVTRVGRTVTHGC